MRKSMFALAATLALLAGCVTINVYFPAAAAQKAADKIIGNILGPDAQDAAPAPAASVPPAASSVNPARPEPLALRLLNAALPTAAAAEPEPNLEVQTPAIEAIEARMRARFKTVLKGLLDSGAVGFAHNGNVAVHDAARVPLAQRAQVKQTIAAENSDRAELYKQIAVANGHPEWAQRMREAFASQWISRARAGWYYQDAAGNWRRK
ncbi:MAG: DUF1318 domain-containing protein [Rhodanobacteraceae bacterium]|nr:MAG: DUF1318 domain-containing protein [Rhodanobacteraceae bacterium]